MPQRRRSLRRVILAIAILLCGAVALPAQNPGSPATARFEHDFGGREPGAPGFRVKFDPRGASVWSITLLDHEEPRTDRDGERAPYEIVPPEYAEPGDPASDVYPWLQLIATEPQAFPGVQDGLDLAIWTVVPAGSNVVRFELDGGNGITIEKTFAWDEGRRDLRIEIALRANGAPTLGAGVPVKLALDGVGLAAPRSEWVLGARPSLAVGAVASASEGNSQVFHAIKDDKPLPAAVLLAQRPGDGEIEFAGTANRFFGCFLYPIDAVAQAAFLRADVLRHVPAIPQHGAPIHSIPQVRFALQLAAPAANTETRAVFRLYLGPKSSRVFDENPEYARFDPVMQRTLDPMCFCSIPGARTIATVLLGLLVFLHGFVGNWGIAIALLTLTVRGLLVPLNFRMQKSMRAYGKKMAVLKPKLDAMKLKYANEPKLLQQQMIAFQRENKMFPPIGGCLPMFLTIPIFIGLFTALRVAYELRLQPFMFWIDDLSRPDQLFVLGLSWLPYFNLLPIIMVGLWLWLQSSTPLPTDPQQRQMMKIMRFMPFIFGITLYNYASGLMVYMITSSVFGLCEQRLTKRLLGPVDPNAAGISATPML